MDAKKLTTERLRVEYSIARKMRHNTGEAYRKATGKSDRAVKSAAYRNWDARYFALGKALGKRAK